MNRITITGRLTRDPEQRALPSGDTLCVLRLAVDQMAPGRATGYLDVTSYGKAGEAAARVLTKGWLVAVDGRLEHRTWQDKTGENRQAYQVVGNVEFLAAPRAKDTTDDESDSADEEAAGDDG